jgi:hypothetical protein
MAVEVPGIGGNSPYCSQEAEREKREEEKEEREREHLGVLISPSKGPPSMT